MDVGGDEVGKGSTMVSDHAITLDVEDRVGCVPEMAISKHTITLDVEEGEGIQVVHKLAVYVTNPEVGTVGLLENDRGTGSSRSGGAEQGSLMDEEWGMSSRSEYAPSEMGSSTEGTVSIVDESCEAIGGSSSEAKDAKEVHVDSAKGSGKGKSRKRRREPTMEGRQWRRKAAGDGLMFDKEGRRLRGIVPELTAVLVKAWVLWRKAFRLTGRLVPFSVYDVALFTGLPVTEKSDNQKSEKGRRRPVFRNYIKVMKKLLDVNKELKKLELWLSLYAWRVMSGVRFPRTPYGAAWPVQKYMEDVHRMGEYAWLEAVWRVLVEAIEEMQRKLEGPVFDVQMNGFSLLIQVWFYEHTIRFTQHDKCRFPQLASWDSVDHGEGIMRSGWWKESKSSRYDKLVACLYLDGVFNTLGAVTDVTEANVHEISPGKGADEDATYKIAADIPGGTGEEQSTQEGMAEAAAPVDGCYDVGDAPHCSESHVQPCIEVEDAEEIMDDAVGTPCGEHDVNAQEPAGE
ncbi:hypothetical protein Cgig2_008827 [Carnegiea gigantea]|uniref:Aminotransferase-like plant mobile domain-containing protein n=1 Tax=Carnegiea gigantea TaxID=171969 RepID=A0A9Q1Q4R9_9CARY|nr:hypothetical protein Cgig2_008827 [Carnegiea gigantea]